MKYKNLKRSLFQVVFQLLTLFHFDSSADVTIISYPELAHDFVEFLTGNNEPREDDEQPPVDPYSEEVIEDLKQTCQELQYARTFELLPSGEKNPKNILDYAQSEDLTMLENVEYEDVQVTIDDFEDTIPLFPCYKNEAYGYVYIMRGSGVELKFLFRRRTETSNPVIYGLVELTPLVDEMLHDQRHLEKYFVQAYRMYEPDSQDNPLSLRVLNGYQHYRLCCLLEDARTKDAESKDEATLKMNPSHELGLDEMYRITFQALDKSNPVYASEEVYVKGLHCYTDKGRLTFLATENPKDPNSVFVLEKRINQDTREREVVVVQHVMDISLLKNLSKFY